MKEDGLSDLQRQWIEDYCNQTITPDAFARFEKKLEESPELRAALRQYLALDSNLRQGSETESLSEIQRAWNPAESRPVSQFPAWIPIAAAAAFAFGIGILYDRVFPSNTDSDALIATEEPTANGYAVVQGAVDAVTEDGASLRAGRILGANTIALAEGSARIDFFSGAQVYIEAPARLEVRSAWEAALHSGKMRAMVPPAARGFVVESNGRRIVDLGTEFGVDTSADEVRVEVFSGEVELEDRRLLQGDAVSLTPDGRITPIGSDIGLFSNLFAVSNGISGTARKSFQSWLAYSSDLSNDPRLIAYYPFLQGSGNEGDRVLSGLSPYDSERDGAVVMAEWVDGRWGGLKRAMEFRRPGSRIRVNLPGEFEAFTFSCWARIDSLDRQYNALFLADSYQSGEPHWQIRNDGVLMIGVMIDDQVFYPDLPGKRHSRNYNSPPFWDMTMSGQWLHLASVFDPANRSVSHFVNGEKVSDHTIEEDYVIDTLRIGNAEIGNWGDPNRTNPEYAIRNLNGRIDELAIFNAALSPAEIETLYSLGQSH